MSDKKNIPAIRFTGFDGEWEESSISQIATVNSGRDYKHLQSGDIPVYGTGGYMLSVDEALSYKCDAVGIGRKGTIDKPYILEAPFWTVDTLFYVTPNEDNNLDFLYDIFQRVDWKKKDESTGVPSLSKETINNVTVKYTDTEEQQAIGNYFKNIDHLITQSTKRLEKLKNLKAAYLEKMFPRGGATTPELRFKGFSEEWQHETLGDCAEIIGGGTPDTNNVSYWGGNIDWYSPAEIGSDVYVDKSIRSITEDGLSNSSARILPIGTVLFSSRAGIGSTAILAKEGATNQGFQSVIPIEDKLDSYFIYSRTNELKKYGEANGSGSTFIEISGKQMAKMPILNPSIEEQKRIGNFFRNIDEQIAKQTEKLDKLKNIKKACLDKMFV